MRTPDTVLARLLQDPILRQWDTERQRAKLRLYAFLVHHALMREDGWVWVSKWKMRRFVGCKSDQTIKRRLEELHAGGYILERGKGRGGYHDEPGQPITEKIRVKTALPGQQTDEEFLRYGAGRLAGQFGGRAPGDAEERTRAPRRAAAGTEHLPLDHLDDPRDHLDDPLVHPDDPQSGDLSLSQAKLNPPPPKASGGGQKSDGATAPTVMGASRPNEDGAGAPAAAGGAQVGHDNPKRVHTPAPAPQSGDREREATDEGRARSRPIARRVRDYAIDTLTPGIALGTVLDVLDLVHELVESLAHDTSPPDYAAAEATLCEAVRCAQTDPFILRADGKPRTDGSKLRTLFANRGTIAKRLDGAARPCQETTHRAKPTLAKRSATNQDEAAPCSTTRPGLRLQPTATPEHLAAMARVLDELGPG